MSAADGVDKAATVLVDPGSDTDYITHDFAASLGLVGTPYSCFLKVVDMDYIEKKTAKYDFDIVDRDGVAHRVHALGLDTVTTLPEEPDLGPIRHLLKGLPDEVVQRPQGKVDILLGLGSSSLHGRTRQEWGNLRLLESRFGCGWVIRGSHELLKFPTIAMQPAMSVAAQAMSQAVDVPPSLYNVFHIASALTPGAEFSELNELGTSPAPVCGRCAGCEDCTFRRKRLSPDDQAVVARMEASMEVDGITGVISGRYPWKPCVDRMCDNSRQAVAVQSSIEKHMLKTGTFSDYVEEMQKAIDEGKVRELSESEMSVWHGPVHYISTFAVVKPGSLSTRTRIVSNSAMRNAISKLSLNDCMYPGPNALADLLSCLLFWRGVEVAIMMDLRKAYQAIHTSDTELHLRRFFFRSSPDLDWRTYAYTRANFGDVAAGLLLEVGKRKVANMGASIDPMAATQLKDYTYVDDGIAGGSREDVERMRGVRVNGQYSGTIARILSKGGMSVKFMAVTGSDDAHEEEQLGGKNLGVGYSIRDDEITFAMQPCYYSGAQSSSDQVREMIVLDAADVDALQAGNRTLTRRNVLSLVMGFYDPLGLISAALVRGKILLRRLYTSGEACGWDNDVSLDEKRRWANWFRELLDPQEIRFPRSTRPDAAVGLPRLVGFCDASNEAVCAVL